VEFSWALNRRTSHNARLLEVDIISEFHILGVNAENLETASRVRNANVYFTIEPTESP
jgi:hypothetical protein